MDALKDTMWYEAETNQLLINGKALASISSLQP
jgi:hypothetical protein